MPNQASILAAIPRVPSESVVERVTPAAVAGAVFLFAGGSSSVEPLRDLARTGRWVGLFVVAGLGVWLAGRALRDGRRFPNPWLALLGGAFAALALVSATWSDDPRLTFARASSFAILLLACAALASASVGRPSLHLNLLIGILAAALLVVLAGAVVAAVDLDLAMQGADESTPPRFRGLGENPNTVPMLAAAALPIPVWLLATGSSAPRRVGAGLAVLVLISEIVASDSRGALLAGFVGSLIAAAFVAPSPRGRLVHVAGVGAVFVVVVGAGTIPQPLRPEQPTVASPPTAPVETTPRPSTEPAAPSPPSPESYNPGRLEDEVARPDAPHPPKRGFLGTSGRIEAWVGALEQGAERPLLGHGFGAEERVFIDRFYFFQGQRPENSLLGTFLQLGAVGALALLAFAVALAAALIRGARSGLPGSELVLPSAGVFAAGLALAVAQSYIYSVGNIATLVVWLAAALGVAQVFPAAALSDAHAHARSPREGGELAVAP